MDLAAKNRSKYTNTPMSQFAFFSKVEFTYIAKVLGFSIFSMGISREGQKVKLNLVVI